MAEANQKLDEMTVPDGGIGNFIMEDAEIEEAYGPDDGMEEYGDKGIAQFPALTKKMAAMGREGDDVVAHLQTGEIVIPLALIEQDEALKEGIFQRLRDMGVEDPERYVVGSEANSINPNTGAAEFFFKKLIKKVAKSVKSVVKVIRKVAPIILPIALSFTPLGPIYGAALGSGIGTLIQGGSIKDALKSALISGATGAVFSGFTGTGSFMQNVQTSLADPIGRFGQTISGAQTSLSNVFGGEAARAANAGQQTFFSDYIAPTAASTGAATPAEVSNAVTPADATSAVTPADATSAAVSNATPTSSDAAMSQLKESYNANLMIARPNNAGVPVDVQLVNGATTTIQAGGSIPAGATVTGFGSPVVAPTLAKPPGFVESIKSAFNPNDNISFMQGMENAFMPSSTMTTASGTITNPTAEQYLIESGINPLTANAAQKTAAQKAVEAAAPGLLRTYGPMAAVGTGVAAASGFFSSPEQEQLGIAARDENGNIITGEDLIAADPSKYLVSDLGSLVLDPNTGTYVPRSVNPMAPISDLTIQAPTYSTYQGSTPGGPFARPYVTAAQGGAIFPRRNGGIMPDEGIPGQDSVRAMLMPGEFVMTTDAVRGAGNGNLNNGIKNMYSVMRNLEARGRA